MGNFKHEKIDLGYDDLTAETLPSGRTYSAPNGCNYPSITTVLSILSREAIQAWRARVGPEEANKISRVASGRGTAVHDLLERYVNNDPDFAKGVMPHVMQSFHDVKEQLDTRLTTVYSQEAPLYSEHLGLAGRVDCVGVWDGKNSIVDYKTSRKLKKKEWNTAEESLYKKKSQDSHVRACRKLWDSAKGKLLRKRIQRVSNLQ